MKVLRKATASDIKTLTLLPTRKMWQAIVCLQQAHGRHLKPIPQTTPRVFEWTGEDNEEKAQG